MVLHLQDNYKTVLLGNRTVFRAFFAAVIIVIEMKCYVDSCKYNT